MKNLKIKLALVLLAMTVLLLSCNEQEPLIVEPEARVGEISFATLANYADVSAKEFDKDQYPNCSDEPATEVFIVIDDVAYTIAMTALVDNQGNPTGETEVIKLDEGTHTVSEFVVKDASGNAIYTVPTEDSKAAVAYGLKGVPFTFDIVAFTKKKTLVDVLCYEPGSYALFGYSWFKYNIFIERELFFFGDICTKYFDEFHVAGGLYEYQNFEGYDFPAIFKVNVYRANILVDTFSNASNYAQDPNTNKPLSVTYLDDPGTDTEVFEFEIILLLPDGTESILTRQTFADGISSENGDTTGFGGADGVFDFNVGACDTEDNNDEDFTAPSWVPYPTTPISFKVTTANSSTSYVKAVFDLAGVDYGDLYDNTLMDMWCAEGTADISVGTTYQALVYSSLNPPAHLAHLPWNALNWLMNNKDKYDNALIQPALWYLIHGNSYTGSVNNQAAQDAVAMSSYIPPVGGWAILIVDADDFSTANVQLMIVRVDP